MMRQFLSFLIVVCLFTVGCSKENSDYFLLYNTPVNDTSWNHNLTANAVSNNLFDGLALTPFIDSFNVTGSAFLRVNANLDVAIPAACLENVNGTSVTPGRVRIELRHVTRRGDFIRYARPTTSYGQLLESISAFQVKFFRADQELRLLPGKKLFFTLRDSNPTNGMNVFFGNSQPHLPFPAGTNPFFVWMHAADSSLITPFVHQDSLGTTKGYQLFAGKTNWINCLKPVDTALSKSNINITLSPIFTNNNTAVFAILKQRKVVVQLNGDYASRSFNAPNIPIGSELQLISLSLIGNQYYLGFKEAVMTQDLISIVNPAAKSKAEISQFLSEL